MLLFNAVRSDMADFFRKITEQEGNNLRSLSAVQRVVTFATEWLGNSHIAKESVEDLILLAHLKEVALFLGVSEETIRQGDMVICGERLVGKLNDKKILISLAGWRQETFLLTFVFFLINRYLAASRKSDSNNQKALLHSISTEIWLAVNAYRIERELTKIRLLSAEAQKEALAVFSASLTDCLLLLLEDLQQNPKFKAGSVLCIPGGFPGHAMYLNVVWFQDAFHFRWDNRLKSTSHYHGVKHEGDHIPGWTFTTVAKSSFADHRESIQNYFKALIEIRLIEEAPLASELSSYLLNLYQRPPFDKYGLPAKDPKLVWPCLSPQEADTCVIENYRAGVIYRLEGHFYKGIPLAKWLFAKFTQEAAIGLTTISNNYFQEWINQQVDAIGYVERDVAEEGTTIPSEYRIVMTNTLEGPGGKIEQEIANVEGVSLNEGYLKEETDLIKGLATTGVLFSNTVKATGNANGIHQRFGNIKFAPVSSTLSTAGNSTSTSILTELGIFARKKETLPFIMRCSLYLSGLENEENQLIKIACEQAKRELESCQADVFNLTEDRMQSLQSKIAGIEQVRTMLTKFNCQ